MLATWYLAFPAKNHESNKSFFPYKAISQVILSQ
jgi:hypothetical protein